MFGQPDNQQTNDANTPAPTADEQQFEVPSMQMPDPAADQGQPMDQGAPAVDDQPANDSWQHPGVPLDTPGPGVDVISPAGGFPKPAPLPPMSPPSSPSSENKSDDETIKELMSIKQEALQKLMPMVDEIEQTPEEHFRTLMMMIQASDDDGLVAKAYESAKAIEDEHARAQALLDIVNEINYFTQPHEDHQE
jgi:hypothetical protein